MVRGHYSKSGYTLIEMLLVVSVVAVLASLVVTNTDTVAGDRLDSASQLIANDLAYTRSLAVANGSEYKLAFNARTAEYTLTHEGSDTDWDELPPSPFHPQSGSNTSQVIALDDLPYSGGNLRILGAFTDDGHGTLTRVDEVTFGPIGQTHERSLETVIWLADGLDNEPRYQSIRVNPVTGLATIGELTGVAPSIPALPANEGGSAPVSS